MRLMHLLIPFAAPLSEAGRQVLSTLALPGLQRVLARMPAGSPRQRRGVDDERVVDLGDEWSLTPPHERALASALGWQGADGCLPWAARCAAADGVAVGQLAWGLLSPTHWHLGTDQVSLIDPATLLLDEAGSRSLFEAVRPLFTSQGFELAWGSAERWYAAHDSLAALPCASLDRVVGRNVDRWLGHSAAARRIRLLQSEVQMLLYGHPLNEAREARGLLPVNSFWLSGCGVAQPVVATEPVVDERLRASALSEDWPGWARAWQTLDEGPIAALGAALAQGRAVQLSLCGERLSLHFLAAPQRALKGFMRGLRSLWPRPPVQLLLERL